MLPNLDISTLTTPYKVIYQCRMCNRIVEGAKGRTPSLDDVLDKHPPTNDVQLHRCSDTKLGILEYCGIRLVTDEKEIKEVDEEMAPKKNKEN